VSESRSVFKLEANLSPHGRKHEASVVPDLVFRLELPRKERRNFAVQIDRGTMPVGRSNLTQTSLKRLLAYSGVAQAGYILVGVIAGGSTGLSAVLYYLFVYMFMNFGAFAVITLVPLLHFGVGFFEQERHMPKTEATLTLGTLALLAGGLGTWLSGLLGDKLARRYQGAYALLAGFAFIFGLPWLLLGFTDNPFWLPALGMGAFCYFLCMPAVNTQIANAVQARSPGALRRAAPAPPRAGDGGP